MALSRVKITFTDDFVDSDVLQIGLVVSGVSQSEQFDWGTLGGGDYVVTVGTPTGTPGETSAINFLSSFNTNLNPSSEYDTSITDNVVTLISNDEITVFGYVFGSDEKFTFEIDAISGGDGGYDNYKVANVRSPYFQVAPINNGSQNIDPTEVDFNLSIWSGNIVGDKPSTPNYTYNKKPRFISDKEIYITTDKQTSDLIEHEYNGTLNAKCVFVESNIITKYLDVTEQELTSDKTVIAFDGYGGFKDGVNPTFNDIMISNRHISVLSGENINIPFYKNGDNYTVYSRTGTTVIDTQSITNTEIINTSEAVEYLSFASNGINNILISNTDTLEDTIISVEVITECTYAPIKCTFVNSRGALQDFYFFKSNKESAKFKNESYKRDTISSNIVGNNVVISYDNNKHTNKAYNKQGSKSIDVNSGYIDQDNNVLIEELLMSEYVWLTVDSVIYPVDVDTKSVEYLTRLNDQLIKYAIKFNYSFDIKQNIR